MFFQDFYIVCIILKLLIAIVSEIRVKRNPNDRNYVYIKLCVYCDFTKYYIDIFFDPIVV